MRNDGQHFIGLLETIKKTKIMFWTAFLLLAFSGSIFIYYTWTASLKDTSENALRITRTAEAGFSKEDLAKLDISLQDLEKPQYKHIKNALVEIRSLYPGVRFAYIYTQKEGKIYFVADSEPVDSKDYSPPGQEYTEASYENRRIFEVGKATIQSPYTDRWGTWISILVPMKDSSTDKTIAVFAMDYPAKTWTNGAISKTVQEGIKVIGLFLVLLIFYIVVNKNEKLRKSQVIIEENESRLISAQMLAHVGNWELNLVNREFWASREAFNIYGFDYKSGHASFDLVRESILPEYRETLSNALQNLITKKQKYEVEFKVKNAKTGEEHFVYSNAAVIPDDSGEPYKVAGTIQDITERKKKELEIFYLSYHDQLTGLYNRRFYEEELARLDTAVNLPLTVVVCDVNGLKLINDSFGHAMGDELLRKVAEILKSGCRSEDIIARLGGDEFVILLPQTDECAVKQIIRRMKDMTLSEQVGSINVSISFGYETKNNFKVDIQEIFNKAEDYMYKKKLVGSQSMRAKTIDAIVTTLNEKNKREEQHSYRVSQLCKRMGQVLRLSEDKIERLKIVGLLHDIGKIAIDENILNKPGRLTEDEWKEIKRHPEIGYRILNTVNEMSDMAKYALHHHERYDGKGYPEGLKGNEIPFVSRIITIADAYDAMASERSYRSALPEKVILEELQKNAGIQFDPELVRVFIEDVLGHTNEHSCLYALCENTRGE